MGAKKKYYMARWNSDWTLCRIQCIILAWMQYLYLCFLNGQSDELWSGNDLTLNEPDGPSHVYRRPGWTYLFRAMRVYRHVIYDQSYILLCIHLWPSVHTTVIQLITPVVLTTHEPRSQRFIFFSCQVRDVSAYSGRLLTVFTIFANKVFFSIIRSSYNNDVCNIIWRKQLSNPVNQILDASNKHFTYCVVHLNQAHLTVLQMFVKFYAELRDTMKLKIFLSSASYPNFLFYTFFRVLLFIHLFFVFFFALNPIRLIHTHKYTEAVNYRYT